MTTPYRVLSRTVSAGRARRRRLSAVGLAVAFIWSMSVVRLVVAGAHGEGFGFDVALATLLGGGTPVALLSRPVRAALLGMSLESDGDDGVGARPRETSGQG